MFISNNVNVRNYHAGVDRVTISSFFHPDDFAYRISSTSEGIFRLLKFHPRFDRIKIFSISRDALFRACSVPEKTYPVT